MRTNERFAPPKSESIAKLDPVSRGPFLALAGLSLAQCLWLANVAPVFFQLVNVGAHSIWSLVFGLLGCGLLYVAVIMALVTRRRGADLFLVAGVVLVLSLLFLRLDFLYWGSAIGTGVALSLFGRSLLRTPKRGRVVTRIDPT